MRITYGKKNNFKYWESRWSEIDADQPMINEELCPLKYSNVVVQYLNGLSFIC